MLPTNRPKMNVDDLAEELIEITSRLPATQADKVRQHISSSRARTIGFVASALQPAEAQALAGGQPQLPPYFKWPADRYGQAMIFIAQFDLTKIAGANFADLPDQGILTLFRTPAAPGLTSKDRKAFSINYFGEADRKSLMPTENPDEISLPQHTLESGLTWTISEDLDDLQKEVELPFDVLAKLQLWAKSFNALSNCGAQLFGAGINSLSLLQQNCAFAAGGITYNAARAADHHYSHLVDEAVDWFALARVNERALFGDAHPVQESILMMRRQDLKERNFDRAWLSVRPRK
jgi:uncharacterized protein YwqG